MKILFTIPYFAPAWSFGGPIQVAYDMARSLVLRGHSVDVATTNVLTEKTVVKKKNDELEGVRIHYFRNFNNHLAYKYNAYLPMGFLPWARANLRNYDILHCHDVFSPFNIFAPRYARQHKVPYFIQPHGALGSVQRVKLRFGIAKSLYIAWSRQVFASANGVITLNHEESEHVRRWFPRTQLPIIEVTNGVDTKIINKVAPDLLLRQQLGLSSEIKLLFFLGRIHGIKGLDLTLQALAMWKQKKWHLVICGREEGAGKALRQFIDNNKLTKQVTWLPAVYGLKKYSLLKAADLLVLNSRSEAMPMVVLEALSSGTPVLISPQCHLPQIDEADVGWVTKDNTPPSICQALDAWYFDRNVVNRRQRAQDFAEAKYSLSSVVNHLEQIYLSSNHS